MSVEKEELSDLEKRLKRLRAPYELTDAYKIFGNERPSEKKSVFWETKKGYVVKYKNASIENKNEKDLEFEEKNKSLKVGNPRYGLLEIKEGITESCENYDPTEMECNIIKCLQCHNSEFKIIFDTGYVLKTDGFEECDSEEIEQFVVKTPKLIDGDIFEYLLDSKSDYSIVRLPDKVMMRLDHDSIYKKYGFDTKIRREPVNYDNKSRLNVYIASYDEKMKMAEMVKPVKDADILFSDYNPLHITKQSRENFKNMPYRFKERLPIRQRLGMFYTDDEYEKKIEDSLSRPLPGDEEESVSILKKIRNHFGKRKR